jgi:DNA polymerase I-like protein with 3'-5' exonuclease and polymerase domains
VLDLPEGLDWVVVDVEAGGLFQDDGARIGSIGIGWPGETRAYPFDQGVRDKFPATQMDMFEQDDPNLPESAWHELIEWLARQKLSAHNAKYDLTMIRAGTRLHPGMDLIEQLFWDTVLAQRELEPIEQAGLDKVLPRLGLGQKESADPIKNWLKRNKFPTNRYDLAPWYIMEPYLRGDITGQVRLQQWQLDAMEEAEDPVVNHYYRELDLLKVLYRMEHRGMAYDHAESLEAAATLRRRMVELREALPFDPDKKAAVAGYFCGTLGLVTDRHTEKKGEPQIDEEQRRKWIQEDQGGINKIPNIYEYDLYVKCKRAISMWYEGWPEMAGPDGRLRCHYKQGHVKSGRMSVQRLQLQAIPKNDKAVDVEGVPTVRSLIRAREGHALWNLDLAQAELRVAAKYAKCYKMLDMLLGGADFHSETTKQVLKVDESHPQWKEKRDIGKRLTFSAIFQIGPDHFQEILGKMTGIYLPMEGEGGCEDIVYSWRRAYPEFGSMYYRAMRVFEDRGWLRLLPNTPYEYRTYLNPIMDQPKSAWNRIVQGSLAEFLKLWLVRVESKWPGPMILTIHDSIVMEMKDDEGDEIAAEVAADTAEFASELFDVEMKCDIGLWTPKGAHVG